MPFITQGKTNWKFLLIVVVLAVIVGGGVLWFTEQQKAETIHSIQLPEAMEPEKTAEDKCKSIQDLGKQTKCYTDLAKETEDESYCGKIEILGMPEIEADCYSQLAFLKDDPSICWKVETASLSSSCWEYFGMKDWKIYRNEEYGFGIKYSETGWLLTSNITNPILSWTEQPIESLDVVNLYTQRSGNPEIDELSTIITFSVYDSVPNLSIFEWLSLAIPDIPRAQKGDIIVALQKANSGDTGLLVYDESKDGELEISKFGAVTLPGHLDYATYFHKVDSSYIYSIELKLPLRGPTVIDTDEQYIDMYNQILSTFRFIEEAQSGSKALFVYLTDKEYDGNLGGRSGADAKCTPPAGLNCESGTIHSLISVSKDDSIINMAENYNFNTDMPIYWYNRDTKGTLILANNWEEMTNVGSDHMNSDIINGQEEGTGIGDMPWTGGLGGTDIESCNQWTYGGDLESGAGPFGIIGGRWKEDLFSAEGWAGISLAMVCQNQRHLRCICEGSI